MQRSAYSYEYCYPRRHCASSERQWQSDSETDDVFLVSLIGLQTQFLMILQLSVFVGYTRGNQ
jgi:hypothetical protein